MYCWGFGWFSSFYYSSDYHLLFLNGICYYGIQGVCPSEETLLQQPWCSLPVACRGDSDDPLEFGGSQPPFAQFVIHKGSLKAGSRHRSCTGNGFPPGAAAQELQRLDSGQVSISATELALPHLAAAAALPKSFSLAQYYSLLASHLSPSVVRQHLLSHRSAAGGFHGITESWAGLGCKAA